MRDELKLFKALSDETRLNIIEFLLDGEKCVCETPLSFINIDSYQYINWRRLDEGAQIRRGLVLRMPCDEAKMAGD